MTKLPLLTTVALALPSKHLAIDHVPHLINHFLVPSTIDAAVYLDLQRVTKAFGNCRPWTVSAMDGAAARGRLDIIKWLYVNRSEGCSPAGCNGAAANNHLDELEWLLRLYGSKCCNFMEALVSAVGAGHLQVVKFLFDWRFVVDNAVLVNAAVMNGQVGILAYLIGPERNIQSRKVVTAAVEAAAKNGLTDVMRVLLRDVRGSDSFVSDGLQHAAAAGHADVVLLLYYHGGFTRTSANLSMEKAAGAGHMKIVFMLLPSCDEVGAVRALAAAVANNRSTLAEFLVRLFSPSQVASAAKTGNDDLHELLAKHIPFDCLPYPEDESSYARFVSAAACGNDQAVKASMDRIYSVPAARIGYVVEVAAALSQCEIVKFLLDEFTSSPGFPDSFGVKTALKRALECKDLAMASLLTRYCNGYMVGAVLMEFVTKYKMEAVKVLTQSSYKYAIAVCATKEYLDGREDVFSVLMEFTQETTAIEFSVKLAKAGKLEFAKRGLVKQKLEKLFAEAVVNGTTELVKFLLMEMTGAVIGLGLLTAARLGHIEVVKLLLGKSEPWDTQFYALEEAAKAGQADVANYLRLWCGPARITTIIADLRAAGKEEAAALLVTKRARLE